MLTYQEMFYVLQTMTPEQLRQKAQILLNIADGDKSVELLPVVCCTTLGDLGVNKSRSSFDNQHHPESIVLMADENPFDENDLVGSEKRC